MDSQSELVRGTVTPIILALLAERAMYGYEMVKLVNARSGGLLEWKEGTLYPTLHRLEGEGLLKAEWSENPQTGKQRKYYRITGRGRRELSKRAAAWHEFSAAVSTLLGGAS